jgi:riboflavin kinase/FMN adenylyltransferase
LQRLLPDLAGVYVGENFRFGRQRKGNAALLRESGAALGIVVRVAAPVAVGNEGVSSTRIRGHLVAGEIEQANALLGYAYFTEGVVAPGKQLGRTIGVPTLNVAWSPDLRPRFGVYAVRVRGDKSAVALPGVANYGVRPTVENVAEPKLEVHVLGECPYDAGDRISVDWLHFIRAEQKFANLDELRAQIARDIAAARARLV